MCHLVLFLPIFALPVFYLFPLQTALPVYAVVIGFSLFFYFKIIKAMHEPIHTGKEAMLGARVGVVESLTPRGKIRYNGELWNAEAEERINKGGTVIIVDFDGLKVLVERAETSRWQKDKKHCKT